MPFFGVTDEVSLSKAAQEARLLLTPYQSPLEFFQKALTSPLQGALQSLIDASDGRPEMARDTHSDLEAVSSALGCLEELGAILGDTAAGKEAAERMSQQDRFPFLLSTGEHIQIYIHIYIHTHVYILTYTYMHTYTHIHTCIHIHTY